MDILQGMIDALGEQESITESSSHARHSLEYAATKIKRAYRVTSPRGSEFGGSGRIYRGSE
jgi:hypothetical protein